MRRRYSWLGSAVVLVASVAACSSTSKQESPATGGSAGALTGGFGGASGGSAGATSGGSGGSVAGSGGQTGGSAGIPDGGGGAAGAATDAGSDASAIKRVFVSSKRYTGNLKAAGAGTSGLNGADNLCTELAKTAKLGGGPWVAWVSAATGAFDRIKSNGPWYLVDGKTLVFADRDALKLGPKSPITVDENSFTLASNPEVWTGTDYGGTPASDLQRCMAWNGGTGSFGQYGLMTQVGQGWTNAGVHACEANQHRLYCFEL